MNRVLLAALLLLLLAACQSPGAERSGSSRSGSSRAGGEPTDAAAPLTGPAGPLDAVAHPDREDLRARDLRVIGREP